MPRVSVLMPVYDTRPEHLREAIDSILAQTFRDFEFLIFNDGSTDPQVEEVVKSYADPRIVSAASRRNLGISGARNRLLDMARGEYLAVMDHDDVSLPERFARQVAYLDEHPDVGVLHCQYEDMASGRRSHLAMDDIAIKKALMVHCGNMCHPACMLRRSVLEKAGLPALERALACGKSPEQAGCEALLALMSVCEDTALMHRVGYEDWQRIKRRSAELLQEGVSRAALERFDRELIAQNASPGGSADLLAICWLLHWMKEER